MLGDVAKNTPRIRLGMCWGTEINLVPPEKYWLCPAWSVNVSSDDADQTVEMKSEDMVITLIDGSQVKLHKFSCVPRALCVGKAVHLVREPTSVDSKHFVRDYERVRTDVYTMIAPFMQSAPAEQGKSKSATKGNGKGNAAANAQYAHILK